MRTIAVVIRTDADFKCGGCQHTDRCLAHTRCELFGCMLNYVPKNELSRNDLYDFYRCRKCVKAEAKMKKGRE